MNDTELLKTLKARFEQHMQRHPDITWSEVQARLEFVPEALESLRAMEETGGEPDVIGRDEATKGFLFCDCSAESPSGRRSLCYDQAALDSRKENKPQSSVCEKAASMGITLLTEEHYRALQQLVSSIPGPPAGSRRLTMYVHAAGRCLVIAVMAGYSSITTGPNPITRPEGFAVCCVCEVCALAPFQQEWLRHCVAVAQARRVVLLHVTCVVS